MSFRETKEVTTTLNSQIDALLVKGINTSTKGLVCLVV